MYKTRISGDARAAAWRAGLIALGTTAMGPFLGGCEGMSPAGAPETEQVAAAISTTGFDFDREYTWHQGQFATSLARLEEGYCFLTGVAGDFEGGGEAVQIALEDGTWKLGGTSLQQGVSGRARCFPWHRLRANPDAPFNPGVILGPWVVAYQSIGPQSGKLADLDNTFCSLAGISGQFNGTGEVAEVNPTAEGWQATARTLADPVQAMGQCVQLDAPPLHWGNEVTWRAGEDPVLVAPTVIAACMLTRVTGQFEGGGEHVELQVLGDHWVLSGGTFQPGGLEATVRCVGLPGR
jgi:hypothetical protein